MTHVLVTMPFAQILIDKLQAVSPDLEIEQIDLSGGPWPEDLTTMAEVIYGFNSFPQGHQSPALRWIQLHSAGINHLLEGAVWGPDIILTTASGIHAPNIGQYVLAQLLAWANRIPDWVGYQASGEWPADRWQNYLPDELRGQTIGILGYGSIGREVARLAKVFGMKVLVTKRDARQPEDKGYILPATGDPDGRLPDRIYPSEATRSMVAECDFVVLTLPLTEKTHHLIDEEILKEMKPTSFLVNISRGPLINEDHLIKALRNGWIGGAGLDVFEKEPLPSSSPLWQMENVILTPHISGFTPYYDARVTDLFAVNLQRYLEGNTLFNTVSWKQAY